MGNIKEIKDIKRQAGFEKLWIWQEANKLMLEIAEVCKNLPRDERFRLRDQVERSSSSVCDNIAEGYTSYYYNDKLKGMNDARKEAGETQNHIRKMQGKGYIDSRKADDWVNCYEKVIIGINSFKNYIVEKRENDSRKGKRFT
jgi:four helix bundle protein